MPMKCSGWKDRCFVQLFVNRHDIAAIGSIPPNGGKARRTAVTLAEWVTYDPFEIILRDALLGNMLHYLVGPDEIVVRHFIQ